MKKYIILVCFFFTITFYVYPQTINGRFSSSIYTYQRFDTVDVSNTHVQSFQLLSLNISKDNFSLKSYFNYENDFSKVSMKEDPRLRFYNLYVEARDLLDIFTIKLGRQPLFNSVAGGLFDGINIDARKGAYKFTAYYGGNVPAYQKFKIIDNWNDNFILGGKFTTAALENFQFSLSYVNKNFKPQDYWASRLDADLNPIKVLIRNNSNQYQFASAAASYDLKDVVSIDTKFDYDLNFQKASKFELNGSYKNIKNLTLNLYYNYREPRIRYNSIFSVFNYGNTQEFELGADYMINDIYTVIGRFGEVVYKGDNSQRFTVGLSSNYGTVTYRKSLGYEGELDAFSVYSGYTLLEGKLTPSLGVSYTNYKLSKDAASEHLAAILAGINYRPLRLLSFDLQGQYMNNRIYKNDFRFFFKINYWFHTNLN